MLKYVIFAVMKTKFNWLGLIIEVVKAAVAFIAGTQV